MNNSQNLWFKRKRYGWGWTPSAWQGWLVTLVYVVILVALSLVVDENSSPRDIILTFAFPLVLVTLAFVQIAYKKGEKPRWQWGVRKKD